MNPDSTNTSNLQTTIAPMLSVSNGGAVLEFYKAAFGTSELFRIDDPAEPSSPGCR